MNTEKKILHLTLKKKWWELIASDVKKEEYRNLTRFWSQRLCDKIMCDEVSGFLFNIDISDLVYKNFDIVRFNNGYQQNCPTMDVEFLGIYIGNGKEEWGAVDNGYFIIKLGKILSIKNYKEANPLTVSGG